ncbi:MAG: hypothetical protein XD63_1310 [Thermoanaerobacterales bacterium 50_218]|nr:MAG: hypothetical protein XD63_1310 [Thermoanaerobacterales bacterium 50_218]HAA89053.1 hypothetical protein [Peptococcaceae bacterium]
MRCGSLTEVARLVAETLARDTEVGFFREVGIRKTGDHYSLVWISPPFADNPSSGWIPAENEVKIKVEPCPERGGECPLCEGICMLEDEIDCATQWISEIIRNAFKERILVE